MKVQSRILGGFIIGAVMLVGGSGCRVSDSSPVLDSAMVEQYKLWTRQIIAREFPHVDLGEYHGCSVWQDKANQVGVECHKDSDREEFQGRDQYCHYNFMRETVGVVLTRSGEMLSASIQKRPVAAECVN